jgi:hypothetical protein
LTQPIPFPAGKAVPQGAFDRKLASVFSFLLGLRIYFAPNGNIFPEGISLETAESRFVDRTILHA